MKAFATIVLALSLAACFKTPEEKTADLLRAAHVSKGRKDFSRAAIELQNAIQSTPSHAEPHYQLGLVLVEAGDPGAAVPHFTKAVELQPGHTDARLKLAQLLAQTDRKELFSRAEEHAREALRQRPSDPAILHALAVAEWRQEKSQAAVEHLKRALAVAPEDVKSAATLALIQWSVNRDTQAAEQTLRTLADRAPNSPQALLALGRFYAIVGKASEAEAQYRQVIASEPNNGQALLELSDLLERAGRLPDAEHTLVRLSTLPDKSYRTRHALFLLRHGKRDAAIAELARLSESDPVDGDVRSRLVEAFLSNNQVEKAEQVIDKVLARAPRDADALEQRGRIHLRNRQFQKAEETARQALRFRPQSGSASYIVAHAYRGQGRVQEYVEELRHVVEWSPNFLDARIELSEALRNSKNVNGALGALEGAPPAQKQQLKWLIERGWVLMADGRYAEARTNVAQALAISRTAGPLIQSGLLDLREKRFAAGRSLLEEAIKAAPDNTEALNGVAFSLASEGKLTAAVERVRSFAASHPKSAAAQAILGSWLERTGDRMAARAAYEAALALDPAHPTAALASARLDMLEGRWDVARQHVQAVLASDPRNVDALLSLGMIEEATGKNESAIRAYGSVLQVAPDNAVAKNNLAVRLSENPATIAEALLLAQQAQQTLPRNPEFDDTLGWIYYRMDRPVQAVAHLEAAAARLKKARVHYRLAMAYFGAGKADLGRKTLAAALAQDPHLPEAADARRMAGTTTQATAR